MAERGRRRCWSRGCGSRRGRAGTTGGSWCSDQHDRRVRRDRRRRAVETIVEVPECPSGPRLAARRPPARRLDARPAAAAARPGRAHRGRRPLRARDRGTATTWSSTRSGRAYVGNFGFDLDGGGDAGHAVIVRVDPDGSVQVAADEHALPERHRHHARRRDVDRGGELRRLPHRVRRRRRRHALEPAASGRSCAARCPTASASTPKARSGPRARSPAGCCACSRAARSPTR